MGLIPDAWHEPKWPDKRLHDFAGISTYQDHEGWINAQQKYIRAQPRKICTAHASANNAVAARRYRWAFT